MVYTLGPRLELLHLHAHAALQLVRLRPVQRCKQALKLAQRRSHRGFRRLMRLIEVHRLAVLRRNARLIPAGADVLSIGMSHDACRELQCHERVHRFTSLAYSISSRAFTKASLMSSICMPHARQLDVLWCWRYAWLPWSEGLQLKEAEYDACLQWHRHRPG